MKPRLNDSADKRILVDANPYITRVVLLEDGKPVELYIERRDKKRLVGNIYKGRVQNVLPGMLAAFININEEKNAFLYVGDAESSSTVFDGERIDLTASQYNKRAVKQGQDIMIQIVKEPIGTKGARASTAISLPGRMLVFMPGTRFVGISKRIKGEDERARLKKTVSDMLPDDSGVIVRTAAEGMDEESIRGELASLIDEWNRICRLYGESNAPSLIHKEDSLIYRLVRDMFTDSVSSVMVNDLEQYELLRGIVDDARRDRIKSVDKNEELFSLFGVEKEIDAALSRRVRLKSGAYIVIDNTEALTSIDVNTGKYVGNYSLENTILQTNKEAAFEIARQLRLRDIGGIVIIDFIDMSDEKDRLEVIDALKEALRCDNTKTVVVGMTGLGLVEVTRKKIGTGISGWFQQECPYCSGSGRIMSAQTAALNIRRGLLRKIADDPSRAIFTVTAHPDVSRILSEHEMEERINTPEFADKRIVIRANPVMRIDDYSIKTGE